MTLLNWHAVFFDFDGVILDSVNVKTRAFSKMFSRYGPEVESAVVKYHLENGGVSRHEKFKYFYENIMNQSIDEDEIQTLGNIFSALVINEVIASPFIDGAYEALETLKSNGVPAYLVSGTPWAEMRDIATKKNVFHFFDEIHGSPAKKWDIVSDILSRKKYKPANCLFVGDALSDYEAAYRNKLHFLGIVSEGAASIFPNGTKVRNRVCLQF